MTSPFGQDKQHQQASKRDTAQDDERSCDVGRNGMAFGTIGHDELDRGGRRSSDAQIHVSKDHVVQGK